MFIFQYNVVYMICALVVGNIFIFGGLICIMSFSAIRRNYRMLFLGLSQWVFVLSYLVVNRGVFFK